MQICKVSREVKFKNGHFADFEFTLAKTEREWDYGNGTCVELVDRNVGYMSRESFDTRYDKDLKADGSNFEKWVDEYLNYRFAGLMA